ncbi:MAG: glutathione S-transferase family protein [Gammaproteobacteria bacterium]|nr:glutathione S-transferase family protein [Gammaproteobacteria bacterium]
MIRLYGPLQSRAARCLWMLEELAIPYEHVPLDGQSREERRKSIGKVTLPGKAPAMEDGSLKLFESAAINLYLAAKYDDRELWPATQAQRAHVLQWAFFAMTELEPLIVVMFMQKFVHTGDDHDEAAVQAAQQALADPLDVLEKQLAKRSHLLGEQFTAADLICVSVLDMLLMLQFSLEAWPKVNKWVSACRARPAYQRSRGAA